VSGRESEPDDRLNITLKEAVAHGGELAEQGLVNGRNLAQQQPQVPKPCLLVLDQIALFRGREGKGG